MFLMDTRAAWIFNQWAVQRESVFGKDDWMTNEMIRLFPECFFVDEADAE